jgi:hypothetical protein
MPKKQKPKKIKQNWINLFLLNVNISFSPALSFKKRREHIESHSEHIINNLLIIIDYFDECKKCKDISFLHRY